MAIDASSRAGSESTRPTQRASLSPLAFSVPVGKIRGWYLWSTTGGQYTRRKSEGWVMSFLLRDAQDFTEIFGSVGVASINPSVYTSVPK